MTWNGHQREPDATVASLEWVLFIAWQMIRWPTVVLLCMIEPFIGFVLSGIAALAIPTAFIFEFSRVVVDFPFWGMIGVGAGSMVTLTAYRAFVRLLAF